MLCLWTAVLRHLSLHAATCLLLLHVQSVLCGTVLSGLCPMNVTTAVSLCLANTTRTNIGTNYDAISNSCSQGVYMSAVGCVEQLNADCEDDQRRRLFLRMIISTTNIERSFNTLCDNLHLYEMNSHCMQQQNPAIEHCDKEEETVLSARLNVAEDMDSAMMAFCKYHWGIRSCTVRLITEACGKEIGNFQWQVASGMIPPICEELGGSSSSGQRLLQRWNVLLLSMLVLVAMF